jgi:predicted acylesterase/phospholipase RssA
MAGAISAGAYTAGVLDFLTEALDEWYDAKARGEAVPRHDVSIEVFSGASAGGMCAAISAVMLQENFSHIDDTTKLGTDNRFYESWVNRIDITELLKSDDLKKSKNITSLLDSKIIEILPSTRWHQGICGVLRGLTYPPTLRFFCP